MKKKECLHLLLLSLIMTGAPLGAKYKTVQFYGFISGDNVHIRKGPGLDYKSLGYLKYGTFVSVIKRRETKSQIGTMNDYWYYCNLAGQGAGWVYGAFIEKGDFDPLKKREKLPVLDSIPEGFNEVLGKGWSECKPAEREQGCTTMIITKNYLTIGYITADTYRLLSIEKTAKDTYRLRCRLKYTDKIIKRSDMVRTYMVRYDRKKDVLYLGKRAFYP